jgi:hypothetical protein
MTNNKELTAQLAPIEVNIDACLKGLSEDPEEMESIPEVLRYLNENVRMPTLKRGDVIHIANTSEYRNSNKFIWNGREFVDLAYDKDEYGHVPAEFLTFKEFPVGFFTGNPFKGINGVIGHNYLHNIDLASVEDLKFIDKIAVEGEDFLLYSFKADGKTWKIFSDKELSPAGVVVAEAWNEDFPDGDFVVQEDF